MPLNLDKEDEVWIGIMSAVSLLRGRGHVADEHAGGCMECKTLGLLTRSQNAYLHRLKRTDTDTPTLVQESNYRPPEPM